MALNDRLREERERLNLSQADFAEKVGVSRNTQVRYETGKTLPPSSYLETIKTMGVDVDYVLFGVPEGEVECTYLESQGIDRLISLAECRRHATNILYGNVRWGHCCGTCPKNPITQRIIPKAPTEIDGALLASIISGIDEALQRAGKTACSIKRAQAIVMIYRASKATGEVDTKMMEQAAILASE